MNALLLSAGLGTRFRPTTDKIAKPAIPFLNVPLLGYSLTYLEQLGLKNLVLNSHHLPKSVEAVTSCLTHNQPYKIHYSHEPKILGSGGGIQQAKSYLATNDDFVVANADEVILFSHNGGYQPLIDFHKKSGALATLLTTDHPEAGKTLGGVWAGPDGQITKLGGTDMAAPGAQHFTGVFIFSPKIFSWLPATGASHIFKDGLHKAMAAGEKVLAFHDPDLLWLDMTSAHDYLNSTQRALEELYTGTPCSITLAKTLNRFHQNFEQTSDRQFLCSGAKFAGALDDGSYLFMGPDSQISAGVEVKNFAVLGANSKFSQGFIESSVIAPGLHVSELVALRKQLLIS